MEIRDLRRDETDFLRQMLYTALAWRPDVELPPREWVLEVHKSTRGAARRPPWLRRSRAGR